MVFDVQTGRKERMGRGLSAYPLPLMVAVPSILDVVHH
jgi:hypothetical protein